MYINGDDNTIIGEEKVAIDTSVNNNNGKEMNHDNYHPDEWPLLNLVDSGDIY